MSTLNITPPFLSFSDTDGTPLDNGYLFIGADNLDPVSNPIPTYWDEALTIPAPNPARISNGFIRRGGTPASLFAGGPYSVLLKNKKGITLYSSLSAVVGDSIRSDLASATAGKGASLVAWKRPEAGALAFTLDEYHNARPIDVKIDFGAVGDGLNDDTTAFLNAIAAAKSERSWVYVPAGDYRISQRLPLHTGLVIKGAGNADQYYGIKDGSESPAKIFLSGSADAVFFLGEGVMDTHIEGLCLSAIKEPTASTYRTSGVYGIKCEGRQPYSSPRHKFERINFYNFERALSMVTTSGEWTVYNVNVIQCNFFNNQHGLWSNTINTDGWHFDTCVFWLPQTSDGVTVISSNAFYLDRCGYLVIENCIGGPVGVAPANPQLFDMDFLHIHGNCDNVLLIASQAEAITNFIHVDTQTGWENDIKSVVMMNCVHETPSLIEKQYRIASYSTRFTESMNCPGSKVHIDSYSDSFELDGNFGAGVDLFTPLAANVSGTGTVVTIVYANHGLTDYDTIKASGSSTAGYNVTAAIVQRVDANTFKYLATGAGVPGTPPTFRRYSRYNMSGSQPNLNVYPTVFRTWPGTPANNRTPKFIGEEVLDTVNGRWYKAISLSGGTGWVALN